MIAGSTGSYPGLVNLAALEQIVFVVPNYRLGAFGFMTLPSFDETDPRGVSGNYGLLDQQLVRVACGSTVYLMRVTFFGR